MSDITPQLLLEKSKPNDYSREINEILKLISFDYKNIEILGSMEIKSQLWASDYDCYEIVDYSVLSTLVSKFKEIIRKCMKYKEIYIGDIKVGNDNRFRVINEDAYFSKVDGKLNGYNFNDSMYRLKALYSKKYISAKEYKDAQELLKQNPNEEEWTRIMKYMRFNVLRWKPQDILNGFLMYRGEKILIQNALKSDGLVKMDLIVKLSNGIFQEFSVIYDMRIKGLRLNTKPINAMRTLINDIVLFQDEGRWFKTLKRMFSLQNYIFKYSNDENQKRTAINLIKMLDEVLSSDIGILYQVKGDMDSIALLLENYKPPEAEVNAEIDNFINRLNNVYSVPQFTRLSGSISKNLKHIQRENNKVKAEYLEKMIDMFERIINDETLKRIPDGLLNSIKHIHFTGRDEIEGGVKYTRKIEKAKQVAKLLNGVLVGSLKMIDMVNKKYGDEKDDLLRQIKPDDFDIAYEDYLGDERANLLNDMGYRKNGNIINRRTRGKIVNINNKKDYPDIDLIQLSKSAFNNLLKAQDNKVLINYKADLDSDGEKEMSSEKQNKYLIKQQLAKEMYNEGNKGLVKPTPSRGFHFDLSDLDNF